MDLKNFNNLGFTVIDNVYTSEEVQEILSCIENADTTKETFRKSADLFAIRQFLSEIPVSVDKIFNPRLRSILETVMGKEYFVVKSIYFDKPKASNWYVSYHQDLTISVDAKKDIEGFQSWTKKQNQFAVQPPIDILNNITTVRIHLDETDETNGALKVIPASQTKGVYRPENIDWSIESEVTCNVKRGGVMLMKPLLLHSSGRSSSDRQRRVIHIELATVELPTDISWSERLSLN